MENNCIVLGDKHHNILDFLMWLLEAIFWGLEMVADQPSFIESLNKTKSKFAIVDLSLSGHGKINTTCELNNDRFSYM